MNIFSRRPLIGQVYREICPHLAEKTENFFDYDCKY